MVNDANEDLIHTAPDTRRALSIRVSEVSLRGRQFTRNKGGFAGLLVLVSFVLCAIMADFVAPYDPLESGDDLLAEPSLAHLMGTDAMGRDVFSRVVFGARISLMVGVIAVVISLLVGAPVGLIGGYLGGYADALVVMMIDIMLAFPGLLLALAIASVLGPSLRNVMVAVGISNIPTFARIARGTALVESEKDYVLAARVIGCGKVQVVIRHILPNAVAPLIVLTSLSIGWSILSAAALGFLGVGIQPPTPEWGTMANTGRVYLQRAAWLIAFPGLAITTVVVATNLVGDALRDALDPRLRGGVTF